MDKIIQGLDLPHEITERNEKILQEKLGIKDEDIPPLNDEE